MKFKRLIPALAMLLVSAILLGTSTFAWFSMNTTVQAANMQVKAVADQGILINEVATANDGNWDQQANSDDTTAIFLHATSTAATATWYSAHSKITGDAADATANTRSANLTTDGYKVLGTDITTATETIAAQAGQTAAREIVYVDSDADGNYDNGEGYYVKYTYYLKSSAAAITTSLDQGKQNLNITATVTDTTDPATSANLDKALRVAVVINNRAYIFAPVAGADSTYYVAAGANATTAIAATTTTNATSATAAFTIPSVNDAGIPAYVYVYFEGEDVNLKTDNALAALDNLTIAVDFSLVTNASDITTTPGVAVA